MKYLGMNFTTGKEIDGLAHILQSCRDILTTPIGSRLARRSYGSLLPELIDHPGNDANLLRLKAATVMALANWEPRIEIRALDIDISTTSKGRFVIGMQAVRRDLPQSDRLESLTLDIGGMR